MKVATHWLWEGGFALQERLRTAELNESERAACQQFLAAIREQLAKRHRHAKGKKCAGAAITQN